MRRVILSVFLLILAGTAFGEVAGLREYYLFYTLAQGQKNAGDLSVIRFNEMGQVLDGPTRLGTTLVQAVGAGRNGNDIFLITSEFPDFTARRFVFIPPSTLSGGRRIFDDSGIRFNLDVVNNGAGAMVGTAENTLTSTNGKAVAARLNSDGLPTTGLYTGVLSSPDPVLFAAFRADGKELAAVTFGATRDFVLLQPLNSSFKRSGAPVVIAKIPKAKGVAAVRISDDGRYLIQSNGYSQEDEMVLYTLDPVTRKPVGSPDTLEANRELVFWETVSINEDGSFVIYNEVSPAGETRLKMIKTANGRFVGTPITMIILGAVDSADMIRAN